MSICTAQSSRLKLVPDSLRCITPSQITQHIEDAYVMKGLNKTVDMQAIIIDTLNKDVAYLKDESKMLKSEISENHKEINLRLLQNSDLQMDYKHLNELNVKANRRITIQKIGLYLLGGIAIAELGYIDIIKFVH
jgi:hypothetical protein